MSHQSPQQSASSLYCPEDEAVAVSSEAQALISSDDLPSSSSSSSSSLSLAQLSDESVILRLLDSETQHMPHPDYVSFCRHRSIDLTARQDSINWILKVHAHYNFKPVTAFLSVNYFDRFLSTHSLLENGWPYQLLSVACLSLAAKMEELDVPLLLDLQLLESRIVFEPGTVQRMELLVMANLNWRLRSVTPFDYLDNFISNLPSNGAKSDSFVYILSTSSDLILNTIRVFDFLDFAPSTIASAAVIIAAGRSVDLPEAFHERVNKEMVRSCRQLMEKYLIDACPSSDPKGLLVEPSAPSSPVGVLDAAGCGSCDTRTENPVPESGSGSGPGSSDAEPANKRPRSSASDVQQQQQ